MASLNVDERRAAIAAADGISPNVRAADKIPNVSSRTGGGTPVSLRFSQIAKTIIAVERRPDKFYASAIASFNSYAGG